MKLCPLQFNYKSLLIHFSECLSNCLSFFSHAFQCSLTNSGDWLRQLLFWVSILTNRKPSVPSPAAVYCTVTWLATQFFRALTHPLSYLEITRNEKNTYNVNRMKMHPTSEDKKVFLSFVFIRCKIFARASPLHSHPEAALQIRTWIWQLWDPPRGLRPERKLNSLEETLTHSAFFRFSPSDFSLRRYSGMVISVYFYAIFFSQISFLLALLNFGATGTARRNQRDTALQPKTEFE